MTVRQKRVSARAGAFDRHSQHFGGQHRQNIFGIRAAADAEAATDIFDHQINVFGRHAGDLLQMNPRPDQALRCGMQQIAPGVGIERRDTRTRLHRIGHQTLAVSAHLGDIARLGKRGRSGGLITMLVGERQIAGDTGMHQRRARCHRVGPGHHGGRRFVFNLDQIGCVLRQGSRLSHHERHRLADVTHTLMREHRKVRLLHHLAVFVFGGNAADHALVTGALNISVSEHRLDTRQRQRRRGIDAHNARRCVR